YQAMSMRDADKQNAQMAAQAEQDFALRFGRKASARMEELGRTNGINKSAYPASFGFPRS
ncbi:MAG: hypothetical protein ACKO0Z_11415, partial [Betaproteobacteria bacterium]